MYRGRYGRAGELSPVPLLAVLLYHVPERHQVQRVQHLIPPLPLALHKSFTLRTLTGPYDPSNASYMLNLPGTSTSAEPANAPADRRTITPLPLYPLQACKESGAVDARAICKGLPVRMRTLWRMDRNLCRCRARLTDWGLLGICAPSSMPRKTPRGDTGILTRPSALPPACVDKDEEQCSVATPSICLTISTYILPHLLLSPAHDGPCQLGTSWIIW